MDGRYRVPIQANGFHGHIDIVLRNPKAVIVAECKRANPALATWCFARSRFVESSHSEASCVALQQVAVDAHANRVFLAPREHTSSEQQYHVAVEAKTSAKGDSQGSGRGALDDALTQALRGASGIVHAVVENPKLLANRPAMHIVPAVITTARP